MPTSNYPFLARNQKTEEERQKDNINALWDQLGVIGMNGKRSFFTGYGDDGKLQPERPTGILNTNEGPRTVHESEQVNIEPSGDFSVIPASQVGGQANLQKMEKEYGMQGYQFGKDNNTTIIDTYKPYTTRGLQRLERYADLESPVDKSIREGERERFAGEAASARGALSQELAQTGIKGREAAIEESRLGRQIGAQESQLMSELRKAESEKAFTAARQIPGEAAAARGMDISTQQWEQSFGFEKQKYGDQEFSRMADDAQTTSFETWKQRYPNANQEDYNTAREYKSRQLQSMDIANKTASENLYQLQKSDKWNDAQRFLDAGDYDNYATIVKQITGRNINYSDFIEDRNYLTTMRQQSVISGALSLTSQEIANEAALLGVDAERFRTFVGVVNSGGDLNAANNTSGLSLTQGQFSQISEKYRQSITAGDLANDATRLGINISQMSAIIEAINNGTPVNTINSQYGTSLTQADADSMGQAYRQRIETGQIEMGRLREAWGDDVWTSVQDMINSGANRDTINAKYSWLAGEGNELISEAEFKNMLDATPLGERNWGRNMTYANMLIQSQDPDNIIQAQRMFADMFPGVRFDMDQLLSDLGAERYAAAMSDMATLSSTFKTWDEAKNSAEGLKLIDTLSLGQDDGEIKAKQMFQQLKFNVIDEEWDTIEESGFYQSLIRNDPSGAELIRQTFTKGLTGELEFDIKPVYNVTDETGKFVKAFDNIADANKFLGDNAQEGYIVSEGSNYIYKDMISGDTVTVNNQTGEVTGGEKEKSPTELYDEFLADVPAGVTPPSYKVWKESGSPTKYENYEKTATPVNLLDAIDVTSYSELLDRNNSSKLWEAYKADSKGVEGSEYYYKFPTADYINSNIATTSDAFGKHTTAVSDDLKKTLEDSIGKMTTIELTTKTTKAEKTGEKITGQITSYSETPSTMELFLKLEDGTTKRVSISPAKFKGDPPMIIVPG